MRTDKDIYSDSFTQFTEALLNDFAFDEAIALADQLKQEASEDILLRPHASEIRRQALLYVFEIQARLSRQQINLADFCQTNNVAYPEIAIEEVEQSMASQGLILTKTNDSVLQIQGNKFDVKGQIHNATSELYNRTAILKEKF